MPGPCNLKKKQKSQAKKEKRRSKGRQSLSSQSFDAASSATPESDSPSHGPPAASLNGRPSPPLVKKLDSDLNGGIELQTPYIFDPGNGPRVRNTRAFLNSYFAQPPTLDEPLCAEFAQEEVLQMLYTVLPEETALILWYNKSRATGRVCPACQRLYRLGDVFPDHLNDECGREASKRLPQLEREQQISGLCSPVCFIVALYDYPAAIKSTWGRMADEMDDNTWDLLNSPGKGHGNLGLCMLLKMTRLDDLGLGQLCLPDVDFNAVCSDNYTLPDSSRGKCDSELWVANCS